MRTPMRYRLAALGLAALLLGGCASSATGEDGGTAAPADTADNAALYPYVAPMAHATGTAYEDEDYGFQLEAPAAGEEIAVLHTTLGDIAVRLFPEGAPETVANFKALIRAGAYDGVFFHRIINDFMIQSGDVAGDGITSSTGRYIPDEFDRKLLNLRGALAMANSGQENQNASQFFINQCDTNAYSEESCVEALASYRENYSDAAAAYKEYYEYYQEALAQYFTGWEEYFAASYYLAPMPETVPAEVWELYDRVGGSIHLDGAWRNYGGHTVFGQVFDGMEVVDAIAAIETDEDDAPLYEVMIERAELLTYDPDTWQSSGLLSPELKRVEETDTAENGVSTAAPVYPLGAAQRSTDHAIGDVYADRDYGFQLETPAVGEEIAVLHTTLGDIRIRLFPEGAPETVANFKTLIREGFYDGLPFCYVMDGFIIQTGDPDGDGAGGSSSTGEYIPDEFDRHLLNLRGALSMGNSGVQNTNTSQFFINQTPASSETVQKSYWVENEETWNESYDEMTAEYEAYYAENEAALAPCYGSQEAFLAAVTTLAPRTKWVPAAVWELYAQNGGNIHLDGQWREYGGNTVFGQVFDGMEVVDAIAAVETDDEGRPLEEVCVVRAELVAYIG